MCKSIKSECTAKEVWNATTQEAKTCKGFGNILPKADTSSRTAISEKRVGELETNHGVGTVRMEGPLIISSW